MKKKVVERKPSGTNVRFSEDAYFKVREYCIERGFTIGRFCEIAAKQMMEKDTSKKEKT